MSVGDFQKISLIIQSLLRIPSLLIRIRILLFTLIWIRILISNLIRIRLFDPDPDPYRFKEVMYLNRYFLYIFTWFSLSVGPAGPTQKVFFVKFSLPVNLCVHQSSLWIRILNTLGTDPDPDPEKWYGSLRIRIRNTDYTQSVFVQCLNPLGVRFERNLQM